MFRVLIGNRYLINRLHLYIQQKIQFRIKIWSVNVQDTISFKFKVLAVTAAQAKTVNIQY